MLNPLAGKPAPAELLIDVAALERDFYAKFPNLEDSNQLVSFGTSGHRGTSLNGSFTEAHILAITQAICEYRSAQGIDGPLFMGMDTHALSAAAQRVALEVLAANGVIDAHGSGGRWLCTPTPGDLARHPDPQQGPFDHAIWPTALIITPSHNPPSGRRHQIQPAQWRSGRHGCDRLPIEQRANALMRSQATWSVKRIQYADKPSMLPDDASRMDFSVCLHAPT